MGRTHSTRRITLVVAGLLATAMLMGACSSDDASPSTTAADQATNDPTDDTTSEDFELSGPPSDDQVATPTVEGPVTGGKGAIVLGPPKFDFATVGYVQEEFFLSGDATTYTSAEPLSEDGEWTVTPTDVTAPYVTRVVVRRPAQAADFDGTVVVEWLNVSGGLDADAAWTFTHDEILRSGAAWVGVSAQRAGIEGGGNSLGAMLALKNADPERYGRLSHPGDDHSYDIFSQAGAAVWREYTTVLGGLEPDLVLAMGESQSAFRLTTYINGIAPSAEVYGGYLVHSRASFGAPLAKDATPPIESSDPALSRTDLTVPVLVFSAETDLVGTRLGYGHARQPDSEFFASWEVGGTAHGDSYSLGIGDTDDGSERFDTEFFQSMRTPPDAVYFGVIDCDRPINSGPHTYVVRSALHSLMVWAREGTAPPEMPRLELIDGNEDVARDAHGNAVGGIRTPHLDVPIATLSGLGQTGESFCALFGTTVPFTPEQLAAAYPSHDEFVSAWNQATDAALASGAILEVDAERLRLVAAQSTIPA
jgi:Alpha/beta hydrolase domain